MCYPGKVDLRINTDNLIQDPDGVRIYKNMVYKYDYDLWQRKQCADTVDTDDTDDSHRLIQRYAFILIKTNIFKLQNFIPGKFKLIIYILIFYFRTKKCWRCPKRSVIS